MSTTAEWLATLLDEHGVPGAQVAVLADGEIVDAAAGVLSTATGEAVTTGSLFQIGSITKVWTATLVAQLVEEGLLDLDRPVRAVLPEFRLADDRVAGVVTPRQLLCHVGGFEGDQWSDTGTGDDCVARYVALLTDARQLTEPGEFFSYCNAGYVVLGRIVEVLRGKPFHVVLRERLVTPLGLTNVATHYDEYPMHQVAEGHLPSDGELRPVDRMMPGSDAPAGSAFAMNARALVSFARMHLESTRYDSMRVKQVKTLDGGGWGLGWTLHRYPDGTVGLGHGGSTMGQDATLRVLPGAGVAVAVLTNGGGVSRLQRAVLAHVLDDLAGVRLPDLPVPPQPAVPLDVAEVVGVYRSSAVDVHVTPSRPGRVRVRHEPKHWIAAATTSDEAPEYVALSQDALIAADQPHTVLRLVRRGDRVEWVHFGRAAVRI
ncbi:serine hydrolase domain-containing protein [Lentzea sp. NPDC059081]|uniref:serine hydrolase domain-containing protein n=1 Tax=Lentzea sp. NPDC059081 TaxID=3346719 RepID=UPI003693726D